MSDTTMVIVILVGVLVLAAAAWAWATRQRRRHLQERFGSEYERTVAQAPDRRAAERSLVSRVERHDQLEIRSLDHDRREWFAGEWNGAQARFVDKPRAALADADRLVQEVMAERGYPVGRFSRQAEDLSVEHSDVLDHYRAAHSIAEATKRNRATTEEQRQAMVHYRALFSALLEDTDRTAETHGHRRRS